MNNVLELEEFNILHHSIDEEHKTKWYEVEPKDEPLLCTHCGVTYDLDGTIDGQMFKKHDTRVRRVRDISVRGYQFVIDIKQRRYNCPACGERFTEFLESIEPNDKITKRLFSYLGEKALTTNFLTLANENGVSVDTVKRAFITKVKELDNKRTLIAPRILGIDEIYIKEEDVKRKQPYAVFTDIENRRVIEFVKGNSKEQVINIIKSMKGYENVEVVTMDMATGYRYEIGRAHV